MTDVPRRSATEHVVLRLQPYSQPVVASSQIKPLTSGFAGWSQKNVPGFREIRSKQLRAQASDLGVCNSRMSPRNRDHVRTAERVRVRLTSGKTTLGAHGALRR